MEEGKIEWSILKELTNLLGAKNQGIILGAAPGLDVAALNLHEVARKSQSYYNSNEEPVLCFKTDPITFPTSEPGRYAVIINANDIATAGALPFGFNPTILLPPHCMKEEILSIQNQIHEACMEIGVTILGGHSEVTETVNHPIVSGAMLGVVPYDYLPSREVHPGDLIVCSGWIGSEGTGILLEAGRKYFSEFLSKEEIKISLDIGTQISILKQVLNVNKLVRPSVIHDATEGGICGALFEMLSSLGIGAKLKMKSFPIHDVTKKICTHLNIDPTKLISSGCVLYIIKRTQLELFPQNNSEPSNVIGVIDDTDTGAILLDGQPISPPEADHVILGLRNLAEHKTER